MTSQHKAELGLVALLLMFVTVLVTGTWLRRSVETEDTA
jgi:hypothetical protein